MAKRPRDVFNRRTDTYGGSFAVDDATITFPKKAGASTPIDDIGLMIQTLNTQYQQNASRVYEFGHSAVYYVGGRTSGNISLQRIVGPRKLAKAFYTEFGDICKAGTNTISISIGTGCQDKVAANQVPSGVDLHYYFCLITSIGLSVQTANGILSESLQLMFSSLDYDEHGPKDAHAVYGRGAVAGA